MSAQAARRAEDLITAKLRQDASTSELRALGAETGRWGRIVALRIPALRELAFYNKARGVNEDDLPHLDAVCGFFTGAGIPPTLEVRAGDAGDRLGAALASRGFSPGAVAATLHRHLDGDPHPAVRMHSDPHPAARMHGDPLPAARMHGDPLPAARMHGDPLPAARMHSDPLPAAPLQGLVSVEELDPAGGDTEFFATLIGGYGLTGARPERRAALAAEHDPATVRRYLARVGGQPAAAASLYLHPDGALLSGAATLAPFRRNGCQSALIARRLADAADLTDLAVVTVAFGSASHANLERAGFRLTHTRTAWRPL